jgi:replicative DNA helicase
MDGIQNMFYILAGETNIGKSSLLLNLALDIVNSNENVFVLFFSVDDSISQLLPRMVALNTGISINAIANPKYKIKLREDLSEEEKEKMLRLRGAELEKLKSMSDRFAIKEEGEAKRIEQLSKYIKIYKKISEGKQLVVFVDNLHRLTSYKRTETRELYMMISDQLKYWKSQYDIPVITTAELRKTNHTKRPVGDDIKETKDLQFDADFVGLLFNDYYINPNTNLKFVRDVNAEDAFGPIVELNVIKNKTSSFKSRLYYKMYPELSKFIECTENERQEYLEGN